MTAWLMLRAQVSLPRGGDGRRSRPGWAVPAGATVSTRSDIGKRVLMSSVSAVSRSSEAVQSSASIPDPFSETLASTPLGQFFKKPTDPGNWKKPKAPDWTPPDTQILIVGYHSAQFEPTSWRSTPDRASTWGMPAKPANDLAVTMNRVELDNLTAGERSGRWFCVVRAASGYEVLAVPRDERWRPASEFELPPTCLPDLYSNLNAIQECRRFNRQVLTEGDVGSFQWSYAVRPLRPLWNREGGDA